MASALVPCARFEPVVLREAGVTLGPGPEPPLPDAPGEVLVLLIRLRAAIADMLPLGVPPDVVLPLGCCSVIGGVLFRCPSAPSSLDWLFPLPPTNNLAAQDDRDVEDLRECVLLSSPAVVFVPLGLNTCCSPTFFRWTGFCRSSVSPASLFTLPARLVFRLPAALPKI